MSKLTPEQIEKIYLDSCEAELNALEPGALHSQADTGNIADFRKAARLSAPFLTKSYAPIGERIEGAVTACVSELKINVNLGVILLAAPLIAAREIMIYGTSLESFQHSLGDILDNLTAQDSEAVFRAIAKADPNSEFLQQKEAKPLPVASMNLRNAMKIFSDRDRAAAQYATNYGDVLTVGVKRLRHSTELGLDISLAITACYLEFFSIFPDSHVAHKFGREKAAQIRDAAQSLVSMTGLGKGLLKQQQTLLGWDANLKSQGINPRTSADLTLASLLAHRLIAA